MSEGKDRTGTSEVSSDTLDSLLKEAFRREAEKSDEREPDLDELTALAEGRLDETAADELMERVADSPRAAERLLDLRRGSSTDSANAERPDEPLSRSEIEEGLGKVLARIPLAEDDRMISGAARDPRSLASRRWVAALLLVGLGLLAGIQSLRLQSALRDLAVSEARLAEVTAYTVAAASQPETSPSPTTNAQIVDLFHTERLRGANESPEIPIVADRAAVLFLTPRDPIPDRAYDLVLTGPEPASKPWTSGAVADRQGIVNLSLPQGFLIEGAWRLELLFDSRAVETFVLRATSPADAPSDVGDGSP